MTQTSTATQDMTADEWTAMARRMESAADAERATQPQTDATVAAEAAYWATATVCRRAAHLTGMRERSAEQRADLAEIARMIRGAA